jgi:hypothetical protein
MLLHRMASILLAAGVSSAHAAPNVPPGDMPGRERERFTPSPLDRFMQPGPPAEPLIRWDCHDVATSRSKPRSRRNKNC